MLGDRLKTIRIQLGHTQESLAELLGTDTKQVWRWENQKTKPDAEIVARIAQALAISSDYLLGLTEIAEPVEMLAKSPLSPKERSVIMAWRNGRKYEAIKEIVEAE